jgi:cell division septum initiation protein DivIVA
MAGNPAPPPSDAGFEVVRRGYDQGQVDAHLRRLDAEVSILVTDRDAALAQAVQLAKELDEARVRAETLRSQVRTLATPSQSPLGTTERIRSMLRLAEDEVSEMRAGAEAEANRRIREADAYAAQTLAAANADADTIRQEGRTEVEKLRQELEEEREAATLELEAARERLAAERTSIEADLAARIEAAEEARSRAWAESEARRTLVEEDFTIAMDQRRAEAIASLTAEREATRREAERLRESAAAHAREEIARAEEQAHERIAEAERRISDLVTARARIAEQLVRTQAFLQDTLGSMALPPEELVKTVLPGPAATLDNSGTLDGAPLHDADQHAAGSAGTDDAGSGTEPTAEVPADLSASAHNGRAAEPADETGTPPSDGATAEPAGDSAVHHPRRRQRRRPRAGSSRR